MAGCSEWEARLGWAEADSTGLRPLPPTPKEDLVVSNLRMARSDFACEHLDEEFNPDE